MATTPGTGLPYPALTGQQPNVPADIQALAVAIETKFPRGKIGYALRSTQAGPVASGSGWVNVSGLGVTVTLQTARTLQCIFQAQATSDVAGTIVGARIWNSTSSGGKGVTTPIAVANFGQPVAVILNTTLPAGTYVFNIQLAQFGGSGGAYFTVDPQEFMVNDIGPS